MSRVLFHRDEWIFRRCYVSHTPAAVSAAFDDPNLLSATGLVPVMRLAQDAGLAQLGQQWLSVPTDKGANAGAKA